MDFMPRILRLDRRKRWGRQCWSTRFRAPVVTGAIIRELPRDAYILDIASKPGGTDFACARECGIRADLALGLPGKYAPKESAYILDRAVERFVRKEHEM